VHEQRLNDQGRDIDRLAKAQRDGHRELMGAIETAVAGIGKRIEGFDAACQIKVNEVHEDVDALRVDLSRRKWSRPELLTVVGLVVAIILGALGIVLQ
jgi:hypothetical protein